jgi:hypothetical protein
VDLYSKTTGHTEAVTLNSLKKAVETKHITFIPSCIRVGVRGGAVG